MIFVILLLYLLFKCIVIYFICFVFKDKPGNVSRGTYRYYYWPCILLLLFEFLIGLWKYNSQ